MGGGLADVCCMCAEASVGGVTILGSYSVHSLGYSLLSPCQRCRWLQVSCISRGVAQTSSPLPSSNPPDVGGSKHGLRYCCSCWLFWPHNCALWVVSGVTCPSHWCMFCYSHGTVLHTPRLFWALLVICSSPSLEFVWVCHLTCRLSWCLVGGISSLFFRSFYLFMWRPTCLLSCGFRLSQLFASWRRSPWPKRSGLLLKTLLCYEKFNNITPTLYGYHGYGDRSYKNFSTQKFVMQNFVTQTQIYGISHLQSHHNNRRPQSQNI